MKVRHLAGLALVLGVVYVRFLRDPILTWGATNEEAAARLPGDELLEAADGVATRAIDIAAPTDAVWPWIAQMGPAPRGGAYTYDWIENLMGLTSTAPTRCFPGTRTRSRRHDRVRQEPDAIERVEQDTCSPGAPRTATGSGHSSRASRWLDAAHQPQPLRLPTLAARVGMVPMEPASLVMERKMLRGIKERAERLGSGGG